MTEASEAIFGLVGVLVGSGISTAGTIWAQRIHLRSTLAAERRAREISASSTALDAIGQLLQMPEEPSTTSEQDQWRQRRRQLTLLLGVASQDLLGVQMRRRMNEIHQSLELQTAASFFTGMTEQEARAAASTHALACLGAYRREEPLPEPPPEYTQLLQSVNDWLAAQHRPAAG